MDEQRFEEYFSQHRQEMIRDLESLVRIESTRGEPQAGQPYGPGPAEVLEAAMALTRQYGFTVTDHEHYVMTVDMNDKPRQLDILAHLDVVPGGEGWTVTEPFAPKLVGSRLYGRGTSDDKGPAVAALYAMRAIKELGVPLSKNVRLILGTDEECGSSDIDYYYRHQTPAPMTFTPDAEFPVINIEKGRAHGIFTAQWQGTDALPRLESFHCGQRANVVPPKATARVLGLSARQVRPTAAEVSSLTGAGYDLAEIDGGVEITAVGTGAHAAHPGGGNNALTALVELLCRLPLAPDGAMEKLNALREMFPHGDWRGNAAGIAMQEPRAGESTIVCSVLHLEDNALRGELDARTPLNGTKENVADVLTERMAAGGLVLDCHFRPPHHVPEDAPLVQELLHCYELYTGQKGKALSMGGGTYVNGLPGGVAFGCLMPGAEDRMHAADEYTDIDNLILCARMFARAIIDLCG